MLYREALVMLVGVVCLWPHPVISHGRLWEPPGRSTKWKRGYDTPVNYDDNQLNCGGFWRSLAIGYKCGTCGDPYNGERRNEAGGMYATGVVTNTYIVGQRVTLQVQLTANHAGWFEFKLCPTEHPHVKATRRCFDRYPLKLADRLGTRYKIADEIGLVSIRVFLPAGLTCNLCVLQWKYHAGNSWGMDASGRRCTGCGPQEEFYGCADIRIVSFGTPKANHPTLSIPPRQRLTSSNQINLRQNLISKYLEGTRLSVFPENIRQLLAGHRTPDFSDVAMLNQIDGDNMVCHSHQGQSTDSNWCQLNCQLANCPGEFCHCKEGRYPHKTPRPRGCRGAGGFAILDGVDQWCKTSCHSGVCPSSICVC